ncbi:MAG: hypothetical protein OXC82_03215 [Rhodobacteraceae bacterium]|nr:hypothetical protein [Paracoccaceae bacterium]MCY4249432.1 hypothetical protein [Paracoccaceae bacterium]
MQPDDLIETARALARLDLSKPRLANLKRAMSTAYYAMFHTLCWNCANSFVDTVGAGRSQQAWNQAYRAVDHSIAKNKCENYQVIQSFPKTIQRFANHFVTLQKLRLQADYNPANTFYCHEVLNTIDFAERMIVNLQDSDSKDRKAFAVWIAIKHHAI